MKDLVMKIHASGRKAVMAITGGGSEAVSELLRHGQGSNTLVEAVIPYDQKAFEAFIRGTPDKFCSAIAARELAMAAYQRAAALCPGANVGIGATCSLMKNGERDGRQHSAFIALQTADMTATYHLTHEKLQVVQRNTTREWQEAYVAAEILRVLARGCNVLEHPAIETDVVTPTIQDLVMGPTASLPALKLPIPGKVVFPGSFNPWHDGHENIAMAAHKMTNQPVDLELSVRNVDKPALNYTDLRHRLLPLMDTVSRTKEYGILYLTNAPTFVEKAKLFGPGTRFVVGMDTMQRLCDPKYGDVWQTYRALMELDIRFLVSHRIVNGKMTDEHIFMPMKRLIDWLPATPTEFSSREIRNR